MNGLTLSEVKRMFKQGTKGGCLKATGYKKNGLIL